MIFPLYWMFVTAVRPRDKLLNQKVNLLPTDVVWSNFVTAWNKLPFDTFYINSIAIALIAVVITVFINLFAGYAFAKYHFRGRNVLFLLMISTLLIPIQVIEVPEFIVTVQLGLVNSWWGVILPRSAEAFGLFLVRQFMVSIPDELLESARLDGAGEFAVFWRVVLPLSGPAIAVLTILTFAWRWNDFAWPIVALQQQSSYTVPLGLNLMRGQFLTDWNGIMSMALLSVLPVLIIFALFQRQFVQGIANTGMK